MRENCIHMIYSFVVFVVYVFVLWWQCAVHSQDEIRAKAIRLVWKLDAHVHPGGGTIEKLIFAGLYFSSQCADNVSFFFCLCWTGIEQTLSAKLHIRKYWAICKKYDAICCRSSFVRCRALTVWVRWSKSWRRGMKHVSVYVMETGWAKFTRILVVTVWTVGYALMSTNPPFSALEASINILNKHYCTQVCMLYSYRLESFCATKHL